MIIMKEMSEKEIRAAKLAEFIHFGQKRRNGEDFVEHSRRVTEAIKKLGYGEDAVCASWLHDTEDFSHLNIAYSLIDMVFGYKVLDLVILLTYTKGTSYDRYVYRIAKTSDEGMAIKWQDMIDNTGEDASQKQLEKYRSALLLLRSEGIEIPEILKERLKV